MSNIYPLNPTDPVTGCPDCQTSTQAGLSYLVHRDEYCPAVEWDFYFQWRNADGTTGENFYNGGGENMVDTIRARLERLGRTELVCARNVSRTHPYREVQR